MGQTPSPMDEGGWRPAPENTLESLRHAIQLFDGVEFDLRITADRQLILHHDRDVSVPVDRLEGQPQWVEEWNLDDLVNLGFLSFEQFLNDSTVRHAWAEQGKMGCIEIKRPHPRAATGGGFLGRKNHNEHIAEAMMLADALLDERGIPLENTVYYAFHKGMPASARRSGTKRPWAALIPYIPPFGNRSYQRLQAFPQYLTMPFARLVRRHGRQGSSMLPCASEYVASATKHLPLGRHVGLQGGGARRLSKVRQGMATYVWPTRPSFEHDLLRAGLTGLTDHADPALTWLPSGHARWVNPGTQPLDEEQWQRLMAAEESNHLDVITELRSEVPTWEECDASRRRDLVTAWARQWSWKQDPDTVLMSSSGATPPWSAPRLIGHRGSGKTSRPVLPGHSR